ncbi:hypothetical protein [Okeania hirsuta]|uniref:hypothetical protein n=1 Tax=Okeania hirsuta TaxID=1458930 RepID=UPI001864DC3F|nr:hypothetical protein [Okeania hirsuta]
MKLLNISSKQKALEELFTQVMCSSVITPNERQQIQNILLAGYLNDDEYAIINRLFYNLRRGWIKLVD